MNPGLQTSQFRTLFRGQKGSISVLVALAFTALIGLAALGIETGLWYALKRQDQTAADAAALSAAYERASGQPYSDICAMAKRDAALNGFVFQSYTCPTSSPGCGNPASGQMCVNNPPVSGTSASDDKAVEVVLSRQQNTFLAGLFISSVTITTRAVAKVNLPGYTCDLAVGTSGTDIAVQGSATINLTGCGMAANSSDASSISFGGGSNDIVNASWFQTVGNYSSNGNPALNVPTRLTDAAPVTDPFSCNPPQLGCAGTIKFSWPATAITTAGISVTAGAVTLKPGLYSNSGSPGGNPPTPMAFTGGTATLCPGVYYIDGEDKQGEAFLVKGGIVQLGAAGATSNGVTCPANGMAGATFIASSQNANKGGGFQIQSGTVTLSAPTSLTPSGCTLGSTPCIPAGLLFYQDPAHADTTKNGSGLAGDSLVTANSNTSLAGAMYTPNTNVRFTGNANSTCFIVIAKTITFTGNSTMAGSQSACQAIGVTGPSVVSVALSE